VKEVSIDGGTTWVDSASVTINVGQSQNYRWRLVATRLAGVDSNWQVNGTITINNPSPLAANNVSVSDVLATDGAATVDCDPGTIGNQTTVNIAAGGSAQCTYNRSLPGANNQLNTATATLFGNSVTGTANVNFAEAVVTEIDESATLSDPEVITPDQLISATQTFVSSTYTYTCGETTTIVNTGQLTETDSGQIRTDSAQITITCIPLGEGCTPGFWQGGPANNRSGGRSLWNTVNDPDWPAAGGLGFNPFIHTTVFSSFFTASGTPVDSMTMYQLVSSGGGSTLVQKTARMLVAAYLNASFGLNFGYTPAQLITAWNAFVAGGMTSDTLFNDLTAANNRDCPL
jgi:hypothetical protein